MKTKPRAAKLNKESQERATQVEADLDEFQAYFEDVSYDQDQAKYIATDPEEDIAACIDLWEVSQYQSEPAR
jgi:hypothetical protein